MIPHHELEHFCQDWTLGNIVSSPVLCLNTKMTTEFVHLTPMHKLSVEHFSPTIRLSVLGCQQFVRGFSPHVRRTLT